MANSLGINLINRVVVVKTNTFTGTTDDVRSRLFKCNAGNGCDPGGMGVKIFGCFLANPAMPDDEWTVIHGQTDIERLATDREVEIV